MIAATQGRDRRNASAVEACRHAPRYEWISIGSQIGYSQRHKVVVRTALARISIYQELCPPDLGFLVWRCSPSTFSWCICWSGLLHLSWTSMGCSRSLLCALLCLFCLPHWTSPTLSHTHSEPLLLVLVQYSHSYSYPYPYSYSCSY